MVQCDRCGGDVDMPFRCSYCGGYFCQEHRLPEFHECSGIQRGSGSVNLGGSASRPFDAFHPRPPRLPGGSLGFSGREVRDLAVSLLLIAGIPVTWLRGLVTRFPGAVLGAMAIFTAAFLIHELAHKFSAQRYGYWAEFRLNSFGLLITLLSYLSPLKIVAPGAVLIAGPLLRGEYGRIALAGPLTNIAQAALYILVGLAASDRLVLMLANVGAAVNAVLALFNLIPFGMFDGAKIFGWNRRAWLAIVSAAALLFAVAGI